MAQAQRHHLQGAARLPFGLWWAIGEALTVPVLMLALRLMRVL